MFDRRQFLTRTGAAAIAAGALGGSPADRGRGRRAPGPGRAGADDPLQADGRFQYAVASDPAARLPAIPFHGPWQAGIVNPPPPAACFVSFNVTAAGRGELIDLLKTLTARARFLTEGGVPADPGPVAPPSDSGTLGPDVPADGLTFTVGFGSTLFDDRFGIAGRKPKHLTEMTSFPNDNLNPALCWRRPVRCRSAPAARTPRSTRCGTSPSTPAAACRSCGGWMASSRRRGPPASRATTSASWTGSRTRTSPIRRSPTGCCGWSPGSVSPPGRPAAATTSAGSSGC